MPVVTALRDELRSVFPARRTTAFISLVDSTQAVEPFRVARDFAGKLDWTKLDPEWLNLVPDGLGSALSFLSDEAICFYIPAYLAADLAGRLDRVDPVHDLTQGFDGMPSEVRIWPRQKVNLTDCNRKRWERLTPQQALAVVHYLEWRVNQDGIDVAYGIAKALSTYWYERAVVPEVRRSCAP